MSRNQKSTLLEMLLALLWILAPLLAAYSGWQLLVENVTAEPEQTRLVTFLCLAVAVIIVISINFQPLTKWAGILMMIAPVALAVANAPFDISGLLNPGMVIGIVLIKIAALQGGKKSK